MANFSPHFLEALEIDLALEIPLDGSDLPYLYIEILFEHGGESLYFSSISDISTLYSLMKQSANALSLLGNIGISFIDINPINIFYNGSSDLLKLVNVGNSFEYETRSILLKRSAAVDKNIRRFTAEFAPPEILQGKIQLDAIEGNIKIMNADIYCWAMCFYSIFLKKTQVNLKYEADCYKFNTEEYYEPFIKGLKVAMGNIMEWIGNKYKLKEFITTELCKALEYTPTKRSKINEVVVRMNEIERTEGIKEPYLNREFKEHLVKLLGIDKSKLAANNEEVKDIKSLSESIGDKINDALTMSGYMEKMVVDSHAIQKTTQREVGVEEMKDIEDECKDCLNECNAKGKLKCGHGVCGNCTDTYISKKFSLDKRYEYKGFCMKCNKVKELSNRYYKNIACINLKCKCKWNNIGTKLKTKVEFDCIFSF
jgi:serine/threonine protein kinase